MFGVVSLFDASTASDLGELERRRFPIEHEYKFRPVIGYEPCGSIKESGKMRSDAAVGIPQGGSITQSNQGQKLIQLTIGIDRESLSPKVFELE
jgi:hypothetical protein